MSNRDWEAEGREQTKHKKLSFKPGRYEARWWNPRTSSWAGKERFDHVGRARGFAAPDKGDWVLQARAR